MRPEEIKKFLEKNKADKTYVKIDFPKRDSIYGLFIKDADYDDLSNKNFWRIVTRLHFDEYSKSKNSNLAKIFNGAEFSRLSLLNDEF
jgi:hypothetical protein